MPRRTKSTSKPEPSDSELRAILVEAMAEVGADPAFIYAFQKTGVYVSDDNEKQLPKSKRDSFDAAVEEYHSALKRGLQ